MRKLMTNKKGYFLFSLDTELAWGYFDQYRPGRFSSGGVRERKAIRRLLDIFDEFEISVTWAVVGHMFFASCEKCENCPVLEWKGKYSSFEQIYDTDDQLWYGADVIELLQARGARHEIGFHGYTHKIFDERSMTEAEAKMEIAEWRRLAARRNITPYSAAFPRNRVGHLKSLKAAGYICYRGDELRPKGSRFTLLRKAMNVFDLIFQIRTPLVYDPIMDESGLLNLPASRWLFGMNRRVEAALDSLGLSTLRIRPMIAAVKRAAQEGRIVHIWAHPEEFKTDGDFEKLRFLLKHVAAEIKKGSLQSMTMIDLARKSLALEGAA